MVYDSDTHKPAKIQLADAAFAHPNDTENAGDTMAKIQSQPINNSRHQFVFTFPTKDTKKFKC